jgi:hypothetical protein
MSAFIKFKQSGSADVAENKVYVKPHEPLTPITKANATDSGIIIAPTPDADGFTNIDLGAMFADLDGAYDFGVSAIDDHGNESPLLTQGFINIDLDFVAPNPPTEGSVYFV